MRISDWSSDVVLFRSKPRAAPRRCRPCRPPLLPIPPLPPMTDFKTRALAALFAWFGRMRPATRQRIGATLGWLTPQLARSRARIVRLNLRLCFPDQPEAVRERWLREHFRALEIGRAHV